LFKNLHSGSENMTISLSSGPRRQTSADRYDPALGAFISVDEPRASDRAPSGDLSGLRVGVKDLIDARGFVTTGGTGRYDAAPAAADAAIVAALRARGAHIVGKTNLNELAYGVSGYNPHFGVVINPKDRSRTAGGSSGGSAAAVASGVVDIAVGTDTSGSVRLPAACCGVYGFKLANRAVSMEGVTPFAQSFDSLGYFTADVADLQRVLGIDDLPELKGLRIGNLGVDLETPALPPEHWLVLREEVWAIQGARFESDPDAYGRDLQWKLRLPYDGVEAGRVVLSNWAQRFERGTADWDVLVGPVLDGAAPTIAAAKADYDRDEFLVGDRLLRHTPMYNELGWPALTCPTADGPVQIAARPGDEAAILAVAQSIGLQRDDTVTSH
jgi:Asp-tRNA(Asn)/Glu-tRNA(Gln) amidotransferase A subunit family amidase